MSFQELSLTYTSMYALLYLVSFRVGEVNPGAGGGVSSSPPNCSSSARLLGSLTHKTEGNANARCEMLEDVGNAKRHGKCVQVIGQHMTLYLLIVKLEPLLGGRADVGVVVASMDAPTVHQDTVQFVQVAHTARYTVIGASNSQAQQRWHKDVELTALATS
ncbi:MAG: hypothetical protein FRX49_05701 [Trebouxia sp. A1-2]|nr:MAG: hypothetical protein FRX49_05701 [Trebouxia sp. A1-2]